MQMSTLVRNFGWARVAVGTFLAVAPNKAGEKWFGSVGQNISTTALLRSVGARDVALGLGLVKSPQSTSTLVPIGVFADVVDGVAALLVRDQVPSKNFRTAFTGAVAFASVGTVIMLKGRSRN
jgi:hypothetical protein